VPTIAPQLRNAAGECAQAFIERGVNPSVGTGLMNEVSHLRDGVRVADAGEVKFFLPVLGHPADGAILDDSRLEPVGVQGDNGSADSYSIDETTRHVKPTCTSS
jgi:hypothetical protein